MPRISLIARLRPAGRKRAAGLAAVALAASAVITGVVATGAGAARAADVSGSMIYVYNAAGGGCSDASAVSGTDATPFCTISAAEGVAQPGQTIMVEPGVYPPVIVSVSGTAGHPVRFEGTAGATSTISGQSGASAFLVSGVHDVVVSGFATPQAAASTVPAYEVTGGASSVVIDAGDITGITGHPAVSVDAASGVTVSRNWLSGSGALVQVSSGASGVAVTGNTIQETGAGSPVSITQAPGTDVTGNTLVTECGPAISIGSGSASASVQNNIVSWATAAAGTCTSADATTAVAVAADSMSGTTAGYNLISPTYSSSPAVTATPYDWGGTSYATIAAFQQATGQGAHDIVADPQISRGIGGTTWGVGTGDWYEPASTSPAVDSANAAAPGELTSDQFDNPRADDPVVANTGAGAAGTYFDRGAVEFEPGVDVTWSSLKPTGPLTATSIQAYSTNAWKTNGPLVHFVYSVIGTRFPIVTMATTVPLTFPAANLYSVSANYAEGPYAAGYWSASSSVLIGAGYVPVSPVRVLDTRNGTGTGTSAPVPANGTVTLPVPSEGGVAATSMTSVVLNVTVTSPTKGGVLTVDPVAGTTSNLNFSAGETIANLVTVPVTGGKVSFHNTGAGTVHVVADFEGFYGPGGSGYQPGIPVRVLDTRNGTGAAKAPVKASGVVRVNLSGKVPADTTAVALNVTVTSPQAGGYLRVYPDSSTLPTVSNIDFTRGETIPNLVIVPVKNGIADIENASGGTVQVVGDLDGYYAPSAPDTYVPRGPYRVLDTRPTGGGPGPVGPGGTISAGESYYGTATSCQINYPGCPVPDALVANVTVTGPTRPGNLTVYPYKAARPNASNVNFSANETIPNLTMTKTGADGNGNYLITVYNASAGKSQVVIDEFGYFIRSVG
jgi:hypothetical protein